MICHQIEGKKCAVRVKTFPLTDPCCSLNLDFFEQCRRGQPILYRLDLYSCISSTSSFGTGSNSTFYQLLLCTGPTFQTRTGLTPADLLCCQQSPREAILKSNVFISLFCDSYVQLKVQWTCNFYVLFKLTLFWLIIFSFFQIFRWLMVEIYFKYC